MVLKKEGWLEFRGPDREPIIVTGCHWNYPNAYYQCVLVDNVESKSFSGSTYVSYQWDEKKNRAYNLKRIN